MNLNGNYYSYSYYQGYHDLAFFIYLIFNSNMRLGVLAFQRISEFFFKDYLDPISINNKFGFETTLKMISLLIEKINPDISKKIVELSDVEFHHYSLEWIIGWFTHTINEIQLVYRLIDYFICSHPLAVYYLAAVLIIEITKTLPDKRNNFLVIIFNLINKGVQLVLYSLSRN